MCLNTIYYCILLHIQNLLIWQCFLLYIDLEHWKWNRVTDFGLLPHPIAGQPGIFRLIPSLARKTHHSTVSWRQVGWHPAMDTRACFCSNIKKSRHILDRTRTGKNKPHWKCGELTNSSHSCKISTHALTIGFEPTCTCESHALLIDYHSIVFTELYCSCASKWSKWEDSNLWMHVYQTCVLTIFTTLRKLHIFLTYSTGLHLT